MGNALAEHGVLGGLGVEVGGVHVAGDAGVEDDVGLGYGFGEGRAVTQLNLCDGFHHDSLSSY